ncbi:MAG TPA: ribose-5-phosphate isomerase RpiA [Candidatus Polarisedimenticolaceae bacterium]|nr:ribose-5-phosphate isomerase RpiA [Candidatus Polarisedimenticolaceae bacterium]
MSRDELKIHAARAALDEIPDGAVIGVGTGSTTDHFIDGLAAIAARLRGAVASSVATERRLRSAGIDLFDLNQVGGVALYVDGADEATRARRLIKGGGGALTREKILAAASERFVCIIDRHKLVERLGAFPLPVECVPMARGLVARELARLGGRAVWREGFTTDNGNVILDTHGLSIDDPDALECELNQLPGIVTVGLFCRRPADRLIVGEPDGVRYID